MSDYRIQKLRRSVEVTLANGHRLDGELFVQAMARFRLGPEEPLDLLNDDDSFLPLAMPAGDVQSDEAVRDRPRRSAPAVHD